MEPILKWAGGKRYLVPALYKALPDYFNNYMEPFCGSAALFFTVLEELEDCNVYLSDSNKELIDFYSFISFADEEDLSKLVGFLYSHDNTENDYYFVRDNLKPTEPALKAARFLFLNKLCYNGLYRVNQKGKFNVPYGRNAKADFEKEIELIFQFRHKCKSLASLHITCNPFWVSLETVAKLAKADNEILVYCDPPYYGGYTQYTEDGFSDDYQQHLAHFAREVLGPLTNVKILLSNSSNDFIEFLYSDLIINKVKNKRSISCDSSKRGNIEELLISNYPVDLPLVP